MASSGHCVAKAVLKNQQDGIIGLWRRVCCSMDDPARERLPERCNREWFCNTFCGGRGMQREASDSMWDLVLHFMMYDPLTLLAGVPHFRDLFFKPVVKEVNETKHLIIGRSKTETGIKNPQGLQSCIISLFMKGLHGSSSLEHIFPEDDDILITPCQADYYSKLGFNITDEVTLAGDGLDESCELFSDAYQRALQRLIRF